MYSPPATPAGVNPITPRRGSAIIGSAIALPTAVAPILAG